MKVKYVRQLINILFISSMLLISSCENNQRNGVERENESSDRILDTDDADNAARRETAAINIENELIRLEVHRDSIQQHMEAASGEERMEMQNQLQRIENRIAQLEEQQRQLEDSDLARLEKIESILEDSVLVHELDRNVRGEGTSLDGPHLNRTGTVTGTEIEKRQRVIENDLEREHNLPDAE